MVGNMEDPHKGAWTWVNPKWDNGSEVQLRYFEARFKMGKIRGPRTQGGGAKKRRGRKWLGLGKRELCVESNEYGYVLRSAYFYPQAKRIRDKVAMTLQKEQNLLTDNPS